MRPDIVDLRQFYRSAVGQIARRYVGHRVREFWNDVRGLRILGLGYATPYLRPFESEAERVLAVMPAAQGVVRWPRGGHPSRVALADETELPLPDESIDRVLLVHALEASEQVRQLLREVWRVLPPSGRLLAVVPNRLGIWARLDRTPFGHGHPFTPPQLTRLLRDNMYAPSDVRSCLFLPPLRIRFLLRSASAFENFGARGFGVGGVLIVEATKQIYAVTPLAAPVRKRARVIAPSADRT